MRLKFDTFYKGLLVFLAVMVCVSFYAMAQGTNAPAPDPAATQSAVQSTNLFTEMLPEAAITFGLDRIESLRHTTLGIPRWQYLSTLIYIFLAFFVSKALDYFITHVIKRWAAKTSNEFDDMLVTMVHGPVKVVSFVIFLHVGLSIFTWPEWIESFVSKGLKIAVAASLTFMLLRVSDAVLGAWRRNQESDDREFHSQLFPIIRKSVKLFIVVIAILVTAQQLHFNITALLASLSVGGLALSLAAQDTVANVFGAVSIFLDKPFKIGERIQWEGFDGVVEAIGLRSTRVRNLDGHLITVPNKAMGNATVTNVAKRPNIRTLINIGVTYDTPVEKVQLAIKTLEEVYKAHPQTSDVWVSFNKFDASALNIFVVHWWDNTDYRAYLDGMQSLNLEIKRRFDAERIDFAFPTQTVHLKQADPLQFVGLPDAPKA